MDFEVQVGDLGESGFRGMTGVSRIHTCVPTPSGQLCALPSPPWILRTVPSQIPQIGKDQYHIAEVFMCQTEEIIMTSVSSREPLEVLE